MKINDNTKEIYQLTELSGNYPWLTDKTAYVNRSEFEQWVLQRCHTAGYRVTKSLLCFVDRAGYQTEWVANAFMGWCGARGIAE